MLSSSVNKKMLLIKSEGLCHANPQFNDMFFSNNVDDIIEAKKMCAECPVMETCLEMGLWHDSTFGVWGGQLFYDGRIVAKKQKQGRPKQGKAPSVTLAEDVPVPDRFVEQVNSRLIDSSHKFVAVDKN